MPSEVPSPRLELARLISELGDDEARVLLRIAQRLRMGADHYGPLALATDRRDFGGKEAREELEDFLVYLACGWLKAEASSSAGATEAATP